MTIQIPRKALQIVEKLENKGYQVYVVGGAVRDALMGKTIYDWDFTTNATPDEILQIFKEAFYDNKYGTVGIPAEEKDLRPYEITTFRTEHGYSDTRRPDKVEWGKTLEEDLQRRDFTINAMALRIGDKSSERSGNLITVKAELIDHFKGKSDIDKKLIRAVGNPHDRFSEDALRMIRAVRIASQLGFQIEEKTLEAIQTYSTLINKIARERVRDELLKILGSPHPYDGIMILKETGLLAQILPEMEKTFGVEQKSPGRHHIYDVGTHSLLALKNCPSTDPIVRLATLIHDIGKPQTVKKLPTGVITFYNHEVIGGRIAKQIAERLRLSKKDSEKLYKLVRWHQFTVDERQTDSAIRRFVKHVGKEDIADMLDLRVGDRLGGGARETSWRLEEFKRRLVEVQKQPFTARDLKITGHDVMKELSLKPGPRVGEILQKLYEEVVEKKLKNKQQDLLNRLSSYKD